MLEGWWYCLRVGGEVVGYNRIPWMLIGGFRRLATHPLGATLPLLWRKSTLEYNNVLCTLEYADISIQCLG